MAKTQDEMEENDAILTPTVQELLDEWGVSKSIQDIFKAQEIDISCLDKITEIDIQSLIPAENIKDRIKLRFGLKQFRKENRFCDSLSSATDTASTRSVDIESNSGGHTSETDWTNEEDEIDPGHLSKRVKKNIDLKQILKSNNSGQLCLATLKKNNRLDSSSRNSLVKSVVEYFIKEYGFMNRNDFEEISLNIESQISNEHKETYYIPSQKYGQGKYIPARGKLVDKYNNHKRKLRSLGIIEPKKKQLMPETFEIAVDGLDIPDEEFEEYKIWLKFNKEPLNEILEKWNKTSNRRIKDLISHKYKSVVEVFEEWPSYKLSFGYMLIEIDFKKIYPNHDLSLFKKWPEFLEKALPTFQNLVGAKQYLEILENHPREDVRDYCFAALIGHKIIPTTKIATPRLQGKSTKYKPSITESKKAFILHVQNDSEVVNRLDNFRKAQLEKGLRCQPLIIVVGPSEDNLQDFYVSCDFILYKISSFLKAIDICFKIFHCLNVEYPPEAIQIWIFVQKYFYNIDLKCDKKLSGVLSFISDLT